MILIMVRSKTFNLGHAQQFIDQNVPKPRAISSNSLALVFMNTLHKNPIVELLLGLATLNSYRRNSSTLPHNTSTCAVLRMHVCLHTCVWKPFISNLS